MPDAKRELSQLEWHKKALLHAVDIVCDTWPRAISDLEAIGFPRGRSFDAAPGGGGSIVVADENGQPDRVPATGVEIVALNAHAAVGWVAELHDVTVRLLQAANPAAGVWPVPPTPAGLSTVLRGAVGHICATWQLDDIIDADPDSPNHRRDVFGLYRLADNGRRNWPPPPKKGDRAGEVTVGERGNQVETCAGCGDPIGGGRADPLKRIDDDPFHVKNAAGYWCYHAALRSRGRLGAKKTGAA